MPLAAPPPTLRLEGAGSAIVVLDVGSGCVEAPPAGGGGVAAAGRGPFFGTYLLGEASPTAGGYVGHGDSSARPVHFVGRAKAQF